MWDVDGSGVREIGGRHGKEGDTGQSERVQREERRGGGGDHGDVRGVTGAVVIDERRGGWWTVDSVTTDA